jgi:TonB family protein
MTITLIAAAALSPIQIVPVAPPPPPPPPVVLVSREPHGYGNGRPPEQRLLIWRTTGVLCRGAQSEEPSAPVFVRAPDPQRTLTWATNEPRTVTLDFRIDESGRPLSIARSVPDYVSGSEDIAPALAASRFAPGQAHTGCKVTFSASPMPVAEAPLADVIAYAIFPTAPPIAAIRERIRPVASTCVYPAPDVLLRAFPAFDSLPDQPGYRSWSVVGYDLDAKGKPRNLKTVAGSGAPALDRASREAVARSRFASGVRTGCRYPYHKNAAILAAPTAPEEDAMRPVDSTCPRDHVWSRPPALNYPASYSRRRIEGWAMIAYDVAPWGQTGNVRVLRSEPTAEFGEAASGMIRGAVFRDGGKGFVGCIDRVLYVMRKPGMTPAPGEEPASLAPF